MRRMYSVFVNGNYTGQQHFKTNKKVMEHLDVLATTYRALGFQHVVISAYRSELDITVRVGHIEHRVALKLVKKDVYEEPINHA